MTSLNPLHTLEKQVAETLLIHKHMAPAAARARTLELLHLVGLRDAESRLGAYPHQLSGGQRQRVMIAMAIANEPDILIADEPTTALDVTIQAQILDLMRELRDRLGMALLLITHDLAIVRHMAERVCVMTRARSSRAGRHAEIFARPPHPYTRRLLAAEPKRPGGAGRSGGAGPGRGRAAQSVVSDPPRPVPADQGLRQGGRRRLAGGARRDDARRRRRKRLGQDDARPRAVAPARCPGDMRAASALPGTISRTSGRSGCGHCGARCRWSFRTPIRACRRACRSPRSSAKGYGFTALAASEAEAPPADRTDARGGRAGARTRPTATRTNSPAASASASRSPARSC